MDRFYSKVDSSGDCHIWTAGKNRQGYGAFSYKGKFFGAYRFAYGLKNGWAFLYFKDSVVRHTCDNRPCVNPGHLVIGSHGDNARDRVSRGRDGFASRTHCKRGHEFTKENTYLSPEGSPIRGRRCRTCHRENVRRYRNGSS